jgi:phosphate transport system substrate-binding protein
MSILQLPSVLIGIAMVSNLPETPGELRLSRPLLADIFLGKIKTWNDPAIAKLNPGMKLPGIPIRVIHRTEGKGANYILADFLAKVSPEFLAKAGKGQSPKWPVGSSVGRSHDMSDRVRATPGAIGYTELNLAQKVSLRIVRIKNAAGEFVKPTEKTIAAAVLQAKIEDDFRVSLTNAAGKESYPISSFTWFYVPAKAKRRRARPGGGRLPSMDLRRRTDDRARAGIRHIAERDSDQGRIGGGDGPLITRRG